MLNLNSQLGSRTEVFQVLPMTVSAVLGAVIPLSGNLVLNDSWSIFDIMSCYWFWFCLHIYPRVS